MAKRTDEPAVNFSTVLDAELNEIAFARQKRRVTSAVPPAGHATERAREAKLIGVAFSGGGIRSATFNLGVLQGLAKYKILPELDYLSTVSGGGYIGSWFLSLLKKNGTAAQVDEVQKMLGPEEAHRPESESQLPISFLRQYSNYLTPRFTFYSADVWTVAATWVRNTTLNLLMLVATIGALLLLPRLLGLLFAGAASRSAGWDTLDALGTTAFVAFGVSLICLNLSGKLRFGQQGVQFGIVLPLLVAAIFLARWIYIAPHQFAHDGFLASVRVPFAILFFPYFAIALSGRFGPCFQELHDWTWYRSASAFALVLLVSAVPAFVSALLLWGFTDATAALHVHEKPWFLFTWGPPIILVAMALGVVIQLGTLGRDFDAAAREWFGRLRAWTIIYSFAWIIVCGAAIYGPYWIVLLIVWHPWAGATLTGGWLGTTITGVLSGKSSETSGRPGAKGTGTGGGNPALDIITRIAPFVFMAGFILAIAFGIHMLLSGFQVHGGAPEVASGPVVSVATSGNDVNVKVSGSQATAAQTPYFSDMQSHYFDLLSGTRLFAPEDHDHPFISGALSLLGILVGAVLLLGFRLDINVFSLHEFYKNRLVRCYLGAVRVRERKADKFTGFDDRDDQKLAGFNASLGGRYCGPYPIINTTMNVSVGQNLAWQERKSAPFVFTPLFSGYNVDGGNEAMRIDEVAMGDRQALKDLDRYAYRRTETFCYPRGVSLGTAVAVSGAATSPNMGFHTSTPVAFLMTVFDVRLGWWVGNPRRKDTYDRATPRFNLLTLSKELFGLTDADSAYVNLSDGGHFDNMGLYELVRRRCRYIIVSDAEQDPNLTFASLTTVLRTCRTDFGVEITIALDRIGKNDEGYSGAHCVVGKIAYPDDPEHPGYLLYLKSSLTGDEPADVIGYHTGHPEFPHQTTADQWFTEAQFESYRKLGLHIVESAIGGLRSQPSDREDFFRKLQDRWYPPSENVDEYSTEHSNRFTDLTLALGRERLDELDKQIFTGWAQGADVRGRDTREELYFATAFISFMHTVYRDLDLESEHEKNHPHNAGWLRIFRYWASQPAFHDAWQRTRSMYGERFNAFYDDLLKPRD